MISVLEREGLHLTCGQKWSHTLLNEQVIQSGSAVIHTLNEMVLEQHNLGHFLDTASEEEKGLCLIQYLHATSNACVKGSICGCCGREVGVGAWTQVMIHNIPNIHHLQPTEVHEVMQLTNGLLLVGDAMHEGEDGQKYVGMCHECFSLLKRNKMPHYSLTNGLWLGGIPEQIMDLTIPEQMLIALVYP